jgi:prevent-host-death family protein
MLDHVPLTDLPAYAQRLLDAAERDDEIVLTRNGRPLAQLLPAVTGPRAVRGSWKGQVIALSQEEFDACNDEIAREFGILT